MHLRKVCDTTWHLYAQAPMEPERLRAEIHLDYHRQVQLLVLRSCTPEERLAAKRLAASHLVQYVRHRETSNFMFRAVRQDHSLTDQDSDNLMRFEAIPEKIASMDEEALDSALNWYITVVEAAYSTYEETFASAFVRVTAHAISQGKNDPMISAHPSAGERLGYLSVLLTIRGSGHAFRFWHSLSKWGDLHVIPPYHPVMLPDRRCPYLINGSTSALIGQALHGVRYIRCPVQAARGTSDLSSDWKVNHPFYAKGSEVRFDIDPLLCVTKEAADLLTGLLIAALELSESSYVGVSGGFRAPEGQDVHVTLRGSEGEAVWGYHTLEKEGALEGAHIPEWLFQEGYVKPRPAKNGESR